MHQKTTPVHSHRWGRGRSYASSPSQSLHIQEEQGLALKLPDEYHSTSTASTSPSPSAAGVVLQSFVQHQPQHQHQHQFRVESLHRGPFQFEFGLEQQHQQSHSHSLSHHTHTHAHTHAHAHSHSSHSHSHSHPQTQSHSYAAPPPPPPLPLLSTCVKTEPADREPLLCTTRMPPAKRSASADAHDAISPPSKHPRPEHPDEFSGIVRKRLAGSSRTGQACDRCKVRKIRCDGLPGGCSPCLNNHSECRTTDRITGRASTRGFVEDMEAKNRHLQDKVKELEEQLAQARNALSVKNPADGHTLTPPAFTYATVPHSSSSNPQDSNGLSAEHLGGDVSSYSTGFAASNYLGISAGQHTRLSAVKGTTLSILGMEIDIADFESPDMDEPDPNTFHPDLHNKSYQAFLQSTVNINSKISNIELPPKAEAYRYVEWYFRAVNPYLPILHKPTFMTLLHRFYEEPQYNFTAAEKVCVNMVFAIILFQIAARNWEDPVQQQALTNKSNIHYHYSIGMFYQLSCSHGWKDVQALTLICSHLRNFPKPGASWVLTQSTLAVAIELNLHRSLSSSDSGVPTNILEVEMRKRIFYSLLLIDITLSGKLGRPMSLRLEDIDLELPEEIPDEHLTESGLDTSIPTPCLHIIGIHGMRISLLHLELYSTVYAARRQPEKYIQTVNSLEAKLQAWKDALPPNLKRSDLQNEGRLHSLYAEKWGYEFRLLLRHPSAALTNDEYFNAENMRICVESSRQMLAVVRQLLNLRSLDTTWYSCATYVLAVTTTIFSQYEKRGDIAQADLTALKEEMDTWLQVMAGVGQLLGSGTRLRDAVKAVIDKTLSLLDAPKIGQSQRFIEHASSSPEQHAYQYSNDGTHISNGDSNYNPTPSPQVPQQPNYAVSTQYDSFSVPIQNPPHSQYHSPSNPSMVPYTTSEPIPTVFSNQAPHTNWHETAPQNHNPYDPNLAWRSYTYNTGSSNLGPDDTCSADALLQLGNVGGRETMNNTPHSSSSLQNGMENSVPIVLGHQHMGGQINGMEHWPNLILGGMGGHQHNDE